MPERLSSDKVTKEMRRDAVSFARSISTTDLTLSQRNPPPEALDRLLNLPPIVVDIVSGDFIQGGPESPHTFGRWDHIAAPFDIAGQQSNVHMYAIDYLDSGGKVVNIFFFDGVERIGRRNHPIFELTGDATIRVSRSVGQPDMYEVEWTHTMAGAQGHSVGLHRMIAIGEYVLNITRNKSTLWAGELVSRALTPEGKSIAEDKRTHFEHMEHIWEVLTNLGLAKKHGSHHYEYTGVRNLSD